MLNIYNTNMTDWRDKLDPETFELLDRLVASSKNGERAYSSAKNKQVAQLWVALTKLLRQVDHLDLKVSRIEETVFKPKSGTKPKLKSKSKPKRGSNSSAKTKQHKNGLREAMEKY